MEKQMFLNRIIEVINRITDDKNLLIDTNSLREIKFLDSHNKSCEIHIYKYFFGLIRKIEFYIDLSLVAEYSLNRQEYKLLVERFNSRIFEIKKEKLKSFLKDEIRQNKLNQILN